MNQIIMPNVKTSFQQKPINLLYQVNDIINQLDNNIFTKTNLKKYTENLWNNVIDDTQNDIKNVLSKNVLSKRIDFFKPKQKDSLFWCFYILKYGYGKYEIEVRNQSFVIEKQEKFKYIEEMRSAENKALIKMYKIKPLSELEDDLANKLQISIKVFFALCVVEKINVLLIDNRKLYECLCNDSEIIYVVHKNNITMDYCLELNPVSEKIKDYKENYYKMPNFEGCLKSVTSYKVDELLDILNKLKVDINVPNKKKPSKDDMYKLIIANL